MRVRRLQRLDDDNTHWLDEAYAYEQSDGTVRFRYNPMIWEGIGARYNRALKSKHTPLQEIERVILTGDRLRWLEIEELDGDLEEIRATLDEACQIPRPHKVIAKPQAA